MAIPYSLGCLPANLKKIQQYLDMASDYETTDMSVSYWCRLYALRQGFTLQKGKEDLDYLLDLMEWLGGQKEELKSLKTVSDLCEARVHLQNVALEFIKWADTGFQLFPINQFNKIVLGAFFSAETLLDVCSVFGELTEEIIEKKKYIDLHLTNARNSQYVFNSEVTAGTTTSVNQEPSSQKQWSPEGKKIYDRDSLLELRNKPASQVMPEKLIDDEITRGVPNKEKDPSPERSNSGKIMPAKGFSKREPKSNSVMRKRSEEDVGKPKNAFKLKEKIEVIPDELDIEEFLKHVVKILSGLTPSTYVKLLPKIKALNLNTEERLLEVSKLLYEKAVEEPNLSLMYAKTCQSLSLKKATCTLNPTESTNFRSMLLARCLNEFEKASTGQYDFENKKKEIECAESEAKKTELEIELGELLKNRRKYGLANIRFIGELFKIKIVPIRIAHQCVVWLLSQDADEEALECLCFLLIAIGKDLEVPNAKPNPNPKNKGTMTSYLNTLKTIANKTGTSDRIRSLVQGVIDLRNIGWLSNEDNNAIKSDNVPNEREGELEELTSSQSPQDIVVDNGLSCNGGVEGGDVKEESSDVDNIIETDDAKLMANQEHEVTGEPQEMTDLTGVCEDLISLSLVLNEAPKPAVDSAVAIEKPSLNGCTSTSASTIGDEGNESVSSEAEVPATTEFKSRLKQYLTGATSLPMNEVFDWIKKENGGHVDIFLIRVLTTCVLENSLEGTGSDSKIKHMDLKHWTALLSRFTNKIQSRELQVLFAAQAFVHKLGHPEYMIQNIFEIMFYGDVVTEFTIVSWMDADNVRECEGHLEALKASANFLSWLIEGVIDDCEEITDA